METILQFKQSDFDRFLSDIKNHISTEIKSIQPSKTDKELSPKQAAAYLRITTRTYYTWVKEGIIPKSIIHRRNRRVYLFESELESLVKKS